MDTEAIDFVVPWVDGSDREWLEEKRRFTGDEAPTTYNCDARYKDWGLIRYLLRSIDAFAPWVRKVHFITWGHLPEWLNMDNPKLNIVNHRDYIPEKYLPTFNSNTILLNLHRIKGIADQFVLFNDDFILLRPTQPQDFFKDGQPRASAILSPYVAVKNDLYYAPTNNVAILNANFKKNQVISRSLGKWLNPAYGTFNIRTLLMMPFSLFYGFYEFHIANSYLKQTFEEVWEKEFTTMDETCSHHIRSPYDCTDWLMEYWQFAKGCFRPRNAHFGRCFNLSNDPEILHDLDMFIRNASGHIVCINDSFWSGDNIDDAMNNVKEALKSVLPEQSSFE